MPGAISCSWKSRSSESQVPDEGFHPFKMRTFPVNLRACRTKEEFIMQIYNIQPHQMDSDQTEDGIIHADIPGQGIRILYPVVGDLFGWLCFVGLLALIGLKLLT